MDGFWLSVQNSLQGKNSIDIDSTDQSIEIVLGAEHLNDRISKRCVIKQDEFINMERKQFDHHIIQLIIDSIM